MRHFRSFSQLSSISLLYTKRDLRGKLRYGRIINGASYTNTLLFVLEFIPTRESSDSDVTPDIPDRFYVDPMVTVVVGFYDASFVKDNTEIALESEESLKTNDAASPEKKERRSCVSRNLNVAVENR